MWSCLYIAYNSCPSCYFFYQPWQVYYVFYLYGVKPFGIMGFDYHFFFYFQKIVVNFIKININ